MNKQTLQNIANHTQQVSNSEIDEIKQLIGSHPFYPLPHLVLAKIYFEKEHYLFENALNQAAMRVNDREWLYHYIHGDEGFINANSSEALQDKNLAENETVNLQMETDEASPSDDFLKNDLQSFLSDLAISEPIEINEQTNQGATLEAEDDAAQLQVAPISEELTLAEGKLSNTLDSENKIEAENIVEQVAEESGDEISTIALEKEQMLDMELRKHPIYNVESFLNDGKTSPIANLEESTDKDFFYWLSHPKSEVNTEEVAEDADEASFTEDKTLSIIEQFIKANPSISRPKKEFYSAENMAKRSENVDFEYVTETLANIYYEQGNIDLAIQAYEKLSLQNPLKQTYFASLIEKIKKEKR